MSPGGWYSSELLMFAIRFTSMRLWGRHLYDVNMHPLASRPEDIHTSMGALVCENDRHWVALRSIDNAVWKLDSLRHNPERLDPTAYTNYLRRHPNTWTVVKVD